MNRRGFLKELGLLAGALALPKGIMPRWEQAKVEQLLEHKQIVEDRISDWDTSPGLGLSEPLTELFSLEIASESMLDNLGFMVCWKTKGVVEPYWEYWDGVKWERLS